MRVQVVGGDDRGGRRCLIVDDGKVVDSRLAIALVSRDLPKVNAVSAKVSLAHTTDGRSKRALPVRSLTKRGAHVTPTIQKSRAGALESSATPQQAAQEDHRNLNQRQSVHDTALAEPFITICRPHNIDLPACLQVFDRSARLFPMFLGDDERAPQVWTLDTLQQVPTAPCHSLF